MRRQLLVSIAIVSAITACDASTGPSELDRSRVLAVRVTPPGLVADQTAAVDVLVGRADGTVAVTSPDSVAVDAAPAGASVDALIAPGDGGWTVTCPPEPDLARMRTALGLDPAVPVRMSLEVEVEVDGARLLASKDVLLGSEGANPEPVAISMGGAEVGDDGELVVRVDDAIEIAAEAPAADTPLAYAWFTSVGPIDLYLSQQAVLTAEGPAVGQLVVVVRDERGGTSWAWEDVRVE